MASFNVGELVNKINRFNDAYNAANDTPVKIEGVGDLAGAANLVAYVANLITLEAAKGGVFQINGIALATNLVTFLDDVAKGDEQAALASAAGLIGSVIGIVAGNTPHGRAALLGYTTLSMILDPSTNQAINDAVSDLLNAAQKWIERRDPLTLDLDGDGIETIAPSSTNPILFDHDGDGIKNGTGWIKSDDGLLVLDRNGNGVIDNGSELFGDSTNLSTGGKAADGFAALVDQDSNKDGKVNSLDANFNQLKIWRDLNQDGISQAAELSTLSQLGINGLNTGKTTNSQILSDGNEIADLGTYTKTDGTVATLGEVSRMADVNLVNDTFHREFPDSIPLAAGVENLPDMQGSGKVRDLREAASQSTRLKDLLTQFSAATTRDAQMALLDSLLDAWADTSGLIENPKDRLPSNFGFNYAQIGNDRMPITIGTGTGGDGTVGIDPSLGTGGTQLTAAQWGAITAAWQQKMHILEAFNGRYFFELPNENQLSLSAVSGVIYTAATSGGSGGAAIPTPPVVALSFSVQQKELLDQSYAALKNSVYESLLMQTRFKPVLDKLNIVIDEKGVSLDYTAVEQHFTSAISTNAQSGIHDLISFVNVVGNQWTTENDRKFSQFVYNQLSAAPDLGVYNQAFTNLMVRFAAASEVTLNGTSGTDLMMGTATNESITLGDGNDINIAYVKLAA